MTAGRLYCIQSWNNASETSGEMIGNRLAQSRALHFNRDGTANVNAYGEFEAAPKGRQRAKKPPIASRIIPAQATLNRVDQQEKELNEAFENSEIDLEEYDELLYVLEGKRERAHKSLCKALGKSVEDEAVGQHRVYTEHGSEGLESYRKQGFSSVSEGVPKGSPKGCMKNLKNDVVYLLTGSIVGLIILLTLTNT